MEEENRLWLFGDSFVQYPENWVVTLTAKSKSKVHSLGVGGASIYWVLIDILNNYDKIKKEDKILICIPSTQRWFFNKVHFNPQDSNLGWSQDTKPLRDRDTIDAFKKYILYLHSTEESTLYAASIASHIINVIIPNLPTNKVTYLFSVEGEQYLDGWHKRFINTREYEPPSLLTTGLNFIEKVYGKDTPLEGIFLNTNNHWIDHPQYSKEWWDTYDPVLEILYE